MPGALQWLTALLMLWCCGNLQEAAAAARSAVRLCPTYGRGYYELAACLEARGENAEALRIISISTQ